MRRLGLVGGLGPRSRRSTTPRRILDAWRGIDAATAPATVIDSLDVQRATTLIGSERVALTDYLLESIERLAGARADFAVMTAHTPHIGDRRPAEGVLMRPVRLGRSL